MFRRQVELDRLHCIRGHDGFELDRGRWLILLQCDSVAQDPDGRVLTFLLGGTGGVQSGRIG